MHGMHNGRLALLQVVILLKKQFQIMFQFFNDYKVALLQLFGQLGNQVRSVMCQMIRYAVQEKLAKINSENLFILQIAILPVVLTPSGTIWKNTVVQKIFM